MSRRIQIYLLGGLILVLVWVLFNTLQSSPQVMAVLASQDFEPMKVQDPKLQVANIEALQQGTPAGTGRNIFTYGAAPAIQREAPPTQPVNPEPEKPPPPAAVQVPFKFYGIVTNPATGRRRAFFTNGDDIWIAEEGQMIDRRFRLLRIGNTTAEVEEISSGRKSTLPLEEPQTPQ